MIILERFCILVLHVSLVLQITTRGALAASVRPNAARPNAAEDLLLVNPDRLSYQLNPGLFKRIPQDTATAGGGAGGSSGGGNTPPPTQGGGSNPSPTGGGGGDTSPTQGGSNSSPTAGGGGGGGSTDNPNPTQGGSNTATAGGGGTGTTASNQGGGNGSGSSGSEGVLPTSTGGGATGAVTTGTQTGGASGNASGGATTGTGTGTSTSESVSTSLGVVTDSDGPHLVTYGSYVGSSFYSFNPAVETSTSAAPADTPLVTQTVPPSKPPPPNVQVQYVPGDAWETTGSQAGDLASTSTPSSGQGGNQSGGSVQSFCNNGTKVSNTVGAKIHLGFVGVEAMLQIVPSDLGGQYEIQLDDEPSLTFDSYKPDLTKCEYTVPWHRTNLDNKPHNITIIVKGPSSNVPSSSVGTISASQVEFGGLVYKGPPPPKKKSTSTWAIVGGAVGAAVVLIAIAIVTFLIVRRRRQQRQADMAPAPFPGPAMSTVSTPGPAFTPAPPSTLAPTPAQTYTDSASFTHSQRPPSNVQSSFEQQYAQMHSRTYSQTPPPSHMRSMSDSSMALSHDRQTSWYEPPPPVGQYGQPGQPMFNQGSPHSSPPGSPPMQPMPFRPMSGGEYDHQNPFQSQAEYTMIQQQGQAGHIRGMSHASSNGQNPFE